MSSEDFRAHLYHSLQGKGILDSLKVQMHNSVQSSHLFHVSAVSVKEQVSY